MADPEKNFTTHHAPTKSEYSPQPSENLPEYGEHEVSRGNLRTRFMDSFKRDPNASATPPGTVGANGRVFDAEAAAYATANSSLQRHLKGRHLQMIAIGGSIGEFGSTYTRLDADNSRNWFVRWLWKCSSQRRSCFTHSLLRSHRNDVVLHSPCSG